MEGEDVRWWNGLVRYNTGEEGEISMACNTHIISTQVF